MYSSYRNILATGCGVLAISLLSACGKGSNASQADSNAAIENLPDSYHADNDIAMTVKSIADAIRVGEPLDTIDYNYEGVLTDGQGHPLYTDIQGTPGEWTIDVTSPTSAVIRNIYLGDLLPEDLEIYLAQSLDLSDSDLVETTEFDDDDQASLVVYDFGGGYLRIETRSAVASNGLEGPLVSIIATKKAPDPSN